MASTRSYPKRCKQSSMVPEMSSPVDIGHRVLHVGPVWPIWLLHKRRVEGI